MYAENTERTMLRFGTKRYDYRLRDRQPTSTRGSPKIDATCSIFIFSSLFAIVGSLKFSS